MSTGTSKKTYKCQHCAYTSTRSNDLIRHVNIHKNPKYRCLNCGVSFNNFVGMTIHGKKCEGEFVGADAIEYLTPATAEDSTEDHLESRAKDPVVEVIEEDLLDSLRAIVNGNDEESDDDLERRSTGSSLSDENRSETQPHTIFKCDQCSYSSPRKYDVIRHAQAHGRSDVCSICKAAFRSATALKCHMKIHAKKEEEIDVKEKEVGKVTCMICSKEMTSIAALNFHMRIHAKNDPKIKKEKVDEDQPMVVIPKTFPSRSGEFPCPECQKIFTTHSNMQRHMRTGACRGSDEEESSGSVDDENLPEFTKDEDGMLCCPKCEKIFTKVGNLRRHYLLKHNEKFQCSICSASFRRQVDLDEHLLLHKAFKTRTRASSSFINSQDEFLGLLDEMRSTDDLCDEVEEVKYISDKKRPHAVTANVSPKVIEEPAAKKMKIEPKNAKRAIAEKDTNVRKPTYGCGDCGVDFDSNAKFWDHLRLKHGL